MRKCLVLIAAVIGLAAGPCRADGCNPTFGDQLYTWVDTKAAGLSRNLAVADYDARTFNYFMITLDHAHRTIDEASSDLERIQSRIRSIEAGLGVDDLSAVRRSDDSQDLLNDLFLLRGKLDQSRRELSLLSQTMSESEFQYKGLVAVGRATLLESINELGDNARKELTGKYSVYVQVTMDDQGNVTGGQVGTKADMVDTVLVALANAYPVFWAVWGFYESVKMGIAEDSCHKKIEEQQARVREAMDLLPKKLVSPADLFSYYTSSYAGAQKAFEQDYQGTLSVLDKLDAAWKELVAFNSLRNREAQTVLTAEKIQRLQGLYGKDSVVTSLFSSMAVEDVANDVGRQNAFVAQKQIRFSRSCGDVLGFLAAEDAIDSLRFASEAFSAMRGADALAPLFPLLDGSLASVNSSQQAAEERLKRLKGLRCISKLDALPSKSETPNVRDRWPVRYAAPVRPSNHRITLQFPSAAVERSIGTKVAIAAVMDDVNSSFCALATSDRQVYSCGAGGIPYESQFESGGNTQADILLNGRDGGYAEDRRRASMEIDAAEQNIQARISDLWTRTATVRNALPDWSARNQARLTVVSEGSDKRIGEVIADRNQFTSMHSASSASALQAVSTFVGAPPTPDSTRRVLAEVGGRNFSLPNLPIDSINPDTPQLAGISASDHAYSGDLSETQRAILRERRKLAADLDMQSPSGTLAQAELDAAERFASGKTSSGDDIARSLLADSASLRYADKGRLDAASITTINSNGTFGRQDLSSVEALPENSVLQQSRSFEANRAVFAIKQNAARVLFSGARDKDDARRLAVLDSAQRVDAAAEELFWSGIVLDGERALHMAETLIDVATRFVPGVNWGRDVYEALTGRDLFTGEQLSPAALTIAMLGVATAGLADEEVEAIRLLRELGGEMATTRRAEEIIEAARDLRSPLNFDPHALTEMAEEELGVITKSEVNDAIDRGVRFWDSQNESLMFLERDVAPGEFPVMAAVKIDEDLIKTVFREKRSEEELLKVLWDGKRRFIKIPVKLD